MFGIVLALLSAMSFGLSQILVRKNLDKSNFVYISLTVTIMGNIILWPLALAFTNLNTVNLEALMLFVIAGLLAPAIARLFYFKGMETAGISTNASIFATYPIYTSITAILLLSETLSTENWIGLGCIIVGVILIGKTINNNEARPTHSSKKGLIIPILGSLAIAFSQIVRKESLNIYNQPLLGVAVGYTTALIVYLIVLKFSSHKRATKFSRQDIKMFWKPGIGIATGWLLSFIALSQEMVSIVAPILQTELLFILLFTYIFLRKIEKISFKLVANAILIITGVILISIN
ncbi:MAG: DMT family transporter [Candidatus Bathyarchaeota archaeon]|nr:DMT family transporter [Candidatus Bathyarchaeum sp.]